ncbi:hypothetical protein ACFLX4_03655 [Chloroflexota bacterium]
MHVSFEADKRIEMKMNRLVIVCTAIILLLLPLTGVIGCQQQAEPAPTPAPPAPALPPPTLTPEPMPPVPSPPNVEIRLAPIHEVTVNIAESNPPQIILHIKGGLEDGCTTFYELNTGRIENTINITVTTQRPKYAQCTQVYSYFENEVNLGSDFIADGAYTINVNEKVVTLNQ